MADKSASVAFRLTLASGAQIACGNMEFSAVISSTDLETTSCAVFPIGFKTGLMESDPPLLVSFSPYALNKNSFTTAQITTYETPVTPDYDLLTNSVAIPVGDGVNNVKYVEHISNVKSNYDQRTIPRITAVEVYETEVTGICAGFTVSYNDIDDYIHNFYDSSISTCNKNRMEVAEN